MKKILFALAVLAAGCKDSQIAQFNALGSRHKITCYSGGVVIYDGESTGNVSSQDQSDGWYWEDAATSNLVEVSGTCVFKQL